jgi:hypothetical protein
MGDTDPHRQGREAIEAAVLRGPGQTSPALRQQAAAGRELPAELAPLVAKIRAHAYRITDEDLTALRGRYSEDELFEVVVAAALGAALHRLDAGLRALGEVP